MYSAGISGDQGVMRPYVDMTLAWPLLSTGASMTVRWRESVCTSNSTEYLTFFPFRAVAMSAVSLAVTVPSAFSCRVSAFTPHWLSASAPVSMIVTGRYRPAPGYHLLDSSIFSSLTAMVFFCPSRLMNGVMSMLNVLYPYFHSPAIFPLTKTLGSAIAPSKFSSTRSAFGLMSTVVLYHPVPIHGSEPERPVFSVGTVSPFCSIATTCLSISLSKGPAMAQSCGMRTVCHLLSSRVVLL